MAMDKHSIRNLDVSCHNSLCAVIDFLRVVAGNRFDGGRQDTCLESEFESWRRRG